MLGGTFIPSPRISVTTADGTSKLPGDVLWGSRAHDRSNVYTAELSSIISNLTLNSTEIVSVIPLGLSGASSSGGVEQRMDREAISGTGDEYGNLHEGATIRTTQGSHKRYEIPWANLVCQRGSEDEREMETEGARL